MTRKVIYDSKILEGKRFGLFVCCGLEKNENGRRFLLWRCNCGKEIWKHSSNISGMGPNSGCDDCRHKIIKKYKIKEKIRKTGSGTTSWKGGKYISGRMFTLIKIAAKARNISVNIELYDIDLLWENQEGKCALTGRKLTITNFQKEKVNWGTASLDRKNSSIGYEINNVQWVHKDVNMAKKALNNEDFIKLCLEVTEYNG